MISRSRLRPSRRAARRSACAASRTAAGTPTNSSGGASSIDSRAHVVHARVARPAPASRVAPRQASDATSRSASGGSVTDVGGVRGVPQRVGERLAQLVEPVPRARDDGHDRHAQVGGQARLVDGQALRPCLVDHVEGDHGARAGVDDLAGQVQRAAQRRGVGHDQHGVGANAGAPEHRVDGDLFVLRARAQAVGARQVDQVDRTDAVELDDRGGPRDRHAGVVADLDVGAGERVEQRGLARVGIAGDQNHRPSRGRQPARARARLERPRRPRASRSRLVDLDGEGVGAPDRQGVVAHVQLQGIAERRDARDAHPGARYQAQFHQPARDGARAMHRAHDGVARQAAGSQASG